MARTAIIIGAGVIGVTTAYALAKAGWKVTLVDREGGPAMVTSRSNGAQLSYCFTDALGSPSIFAALPQLLSGKGGVSIGKSLRPDYLRWLARFAGNCTSARFRLNTLALLDLAHQSRIAMDELCQRHEIDFAHRVAGKIQLLYSEKDRQIAQSVMALKQQAGCAQNMLERAELEELDPALHDLDDDVVAAVSTPSEVVGDPLLFCQSLLGILKAEYGVLTRFNTDVSAVEDNGQSAKVHLQGGEVLSSDTIVLAAANGSNALLAPLGQSLSVQPMKGYSFEMPTSNGSPQISVTDGKRRLVFTNLGGRMRVAGIAELGETSLAIDEGRIEWLMQSAQDCLPNAGNYSQANGFWSGLRPTTPNSQPIIKRASKVLAINTGHGSLGWTLAMGSASRLAALLDS